MRLPSASIQDFAHTASYSCIWLYHALASVQPNQDCLPHFRQPPMHSFVHHCTVLPRGICCRCRMLHCLLECLCQTTIWSHTHCRPSMTISTPATLVYSRHLMTYTQWCQQHRCGLHTAQHLHMNQFYLWGRSVGDEKLTARVF